MTPEFESFYNNHLSAVEGGEVDHDLDGGGHTWYGISSGFLEDIGRKGPVSKADAKQIAYDYFWEPSGCQQMDAVAGWAYCDALFNHSPKPAAEMLQHALQVEVDGVVGPKTRDAATVINRKLFLERYRVERTRYYQSLIVANPNQIAFLVGWVDRISRLQQSMIVSGLMADDLKKLPWYKTVGTNTKVAGIGAASFAGFVALFWPDLDFSTITNALKDPDLLKGGYFAAAVSLAAKWQAKRS